MNTYNTSLQRLIDIVAELRIKCPWDQKQTFDSLKSQTIEEVYELIDAINHEDYENIEEELGDILLHIIFYAQMGQELEKFSVDDVVLKICNKLVRRHPHVYGNTSVKNEEEVKKNWEMLKQKEGKKSILSGIPQSLPAMNRAMAIQKKASHVGFDWNDPMEMLNKVKEEIRELEKEIEDNNIENIQNELGDLMFSILNINRFYKFNEDDTLNLCNNKFIRRFQYIEKVLDSRNQKLNETDLAELENLWQTSKLNDQDL